MHHRHGIMRIDRWNPRHGMTGQSCWRNLILPLALTALLLAMDAHAHPGHEDALTKVQAVAIAKAAIRRLVADGKPVQGEVLPETWSEIDGYPKCSATPVYYLISLDNYSEGKTIHVLLNHSGRFMRARFDPNFAELTFSSFPVFACERW
ncbi:MAG: DUF6488 family protein [Pseudomonadota bacterium]